MADEAGSDSGLLQVELVAADRTVWTGEATMVIARTSDGEVGVLPHHAPLLGTLVDGAVLIRQPSGEAVAAAVPVVVQPVVDAGPIIHAGALKLRGRESLQRA